jgi:hypothetical protein
MNSFATEVLCRGEDCRDAVSPAVTTVDLQLCARCVQLLRSRIAGAPKLYQDCEQALSGGAAQGVRQRTTGGPLPGLPFNEAAADARAGMVSTLASWSGLLAEEHGLPAPARSVDRCARFLLDHLDLLAAHPAAADAAEEVARMVTAARRIVHSDPARRVRVGSCIESGCPGTLHVVLGDSSARSSGHVQCSWNASHTWLSHTWLQLRESIQNAKAGQPIVDRWLTAQEIAYMWHRPIGTVYRLASEQRWRRRSDSGRTRYAQADVQASPSRPGPVG